MTIRAFQEHSDSTMPARLRPTVYVGKREESGMEHGMYIPDKTQLDKLVRWVSDDINRPNEPLYWAIEKARQLDAIKGPRCVNLSGWFGAFADSPDDFPPYIEALRPTMDAMVRKLDRNDILWADCEPRVPQDQIIPKLQLIAKLGWALCESGVIGAARLGIQGIAYGRRPPQPGRFWTANLADGSTSYCPIMVQKGVDPAAHLEWVRKCVGDTLDSHLHPLCHDTGMNVSQDGKDFDSAEKDLHRQTIRLCKSLAGNDWTYLCYALAGRDDKDLIVDPAARRAEDRATWEALST